MKKKPATIIEFGTVKLEYAAYLSDKEIEEIKKKHNVEHVTIKRKRIEKR